MVAEQLARFIGGDRTALMNMVEMWMRGGYYATAGHAFEFPDSLSDLQADYNEVVADSLPGQMDRLGKEKGNPAATEECKRLAAVAAKIEPRLRKCNDFKNEATKAEMLSRLTNRQALLNEAIAGFGGMGKKAAVDPKVLEDKCDRLTTLCRAYYQEQNQIAQELDDADTGTASERVDARKLIKKMEDMHLRWWNDYHLLQDAYEQRGMKTPDETYLRPAEKLVAYYEKKIGDS